jgi:hypothetical protein
MMKKRKFGSGGMPSMKESMESGNRVSRQVGAETKKLMPATRSTRPSVGDAIASGNRMSKKNAEDLKAVKKYAKGGKVKPVDVDMKGLEEASRSKTSFDTSGLESKGAEARKANAAQAKEAKKQSFRDAFAAARKKALAGGPDTFKWMGKSYGTQLAGEKPKAKPEAKSEVKSGADKSRSNNPYDSKTSMSSIRRNIDTNNSQMSDAQIRKFMRGLDADADRSLDDTKIRKYMQGLDADADRSLAAMKAKKEAKMASDIGKATTASLSDAASRAIPRTPSMAKGGSVTRGDGIAKKGHTKGKIC